MLSIAIEHSFGLLIPIFALFCVFGCKALKIILCRPPAQQDMNAEDRARIIRITEMIDKIQNRVTALETLLKDEQANKVVTHEKTT